MREGKGRGNDDGGKMEEEGRRHRERSGEEAEFLEVSASLD